MFVIHLLVLRAKKHRILFVVTGGMKFGCGFKVMVDLANLADQAHVRIGAANKSWSKTEVTPQERFPTVVGKSPKLQQEGITCLS